MINRELFQKIHEIISAHPEQHDQGSWEGTRGPDCGTTRCVAGWAVFLTTGEPLTRSTNTGIMGNSLATQELLRENDWESIPEAGRRLLGLNEDVACSLFYDASNEEARAAVKAFSEGRESDALRHISYYW